jgi:Fe2+ or Zn2+ uptake regulation protein
MNTFKEILENKGISPSYSRMRIYAYFEQENHHPTIDEIYQALKPELPTLSKTTVYNTLNLFNEKGLTECVITESLEQRYELVNHKHSHFKCNECGEIYDIPYIKPNYDMKELSGFIVSNDIVTLTGICVTCQKK